jgi:single-strand DNA-binding protein
MNNCTFIGTFVRDPELRTGSVNVANFTLAVNRRFKKEGQPDADFPRFVAFAKTAETIQKYFKKGDEIAIVGHLQTGSYEGKNGTVYTTDIIVDNFSFTRGKKSEQPQQNNYQDQNSYQSSDDPGDDVPF